MPDFLDAHNRHWVDGESLFAGGRLANADHLFGLSAECGMKKLMQGLNIVPFEPDGNPEKKFRRHANELWGLYMSNISGIHATKYSLRTFNPFHLWKAEQRYEAESTFAQQTVSEHRDGALMVRNLIKTAQTNGDL